MYSKKTKGFLAFANIFLALDVICCIVPLVLLVISSFTDNTTLIRNGYQFIPEKFSLDAYAYLLKSGKLIMKAYGMSFVVTGLEVASHKHYIVSTYKKIRDQQCPDRIFDVEHAGIHHICRNQATIE